MSDPEPLDLVEFLRARLDEQEERHTADWWQECKVCREPVPCWHVRDVEAKRRIIRAHAKHCNGDCEAPYPQAGLDAGYYWAIKVHAAVYAAHPDYQEAWRP